MGKQDLGKERRRFIGFHKHFGVNIVALNGVDTLPKLDHEVGVNISLTGMLIKCERPIKKGSKARVKIMLVKNGVYRTVEASARIMWCDKSFDQKTAYCIGMEFARLMRGKRIALAWFFK